MFHSLHWLKIGTMYWILSIFTVHEWTMVRCTIVFTLKKVKMFQCWKFLVWRSKGFKVASCQTLRIICPQVGSTRPNALAHTSAGMAKAADFFLRIPNLKASNFVALWPTDPILLAWKDPNLFDIHYTYYLVKRLAVFLRWVLLLGWFKSGKNDKLDIFLLFWPDSESFGKWCLEKCKNFFDTTTLMPAKSLF